MYVIWKKHFVHVLLLLTLVILSSCCHPKIIMLNESGLDYAAIPNNYSGSVTDIDGNIYRTITIGTQTWMADNLRVTRLNDGSEMYFIWDPSVSSSYDSPGYTWNNPVDPRNAPPICRRYGALYNYPAVESKKVCPVGWHVPSDDEWSTLADYLGGTSVAGGKMKVPGNIYWKEPNIGATNESGFTALPGGEIQADDLPISLVGFMYSAFWWTSDRLHTTYILNRYSFLEISYEDMNPVIGCSIRCVEN